MNNKGADQTARMRRVIYTFVFRIWHKTHFHMTGPNYNNSLLCPNFSDFPRMSGEVHLYISQSLAKLTMLTGKTWSCLISLCCLPDPGPPEGHPLKTDQTLKNVQTYLNLCWCMHGFVCFALLQLIWAISRENHQSGICTQQRLRSESSLCA